MSPEGRLRKLPGRLYYQVRLLPFIGRAKPGRKYGEDFVASYALEYRDYGHHVKQLMQGKLKGGGI